jgi:hypothetical protein
VIASALSPACASVPASVLAIVAGAGAVGFSGSRTIGAGSAVPECVATVCAAVSPRALVSVGCAAGVDSLVRSLVCGASVFRASSFSASSFVGRLVLRSAAVVRFVAACGRPSVFVVFPSSACPAGLLPSPVVSRCFRGLGSGSWASAAFAAGLGVPLLVFSPSDSLGVPAWGFAPLGSGWFLLAPPPALF